MNLKDLINNIIGLADAVPDIHTTFEGNIFDLNAYENIQYSAFVVTQGQHSQPNRDFFTANLHLFYVDREEPTGDNRLDVQSHAVEILSNILKQLEDIHDLQIENITYNTFHERFQAICSGAFVSFSVTFPLSDCSDNY